ncbi:MAG: hypothetical protein AB1349_09325 [Elusimicrobiota bacterium]
MKMITENYNTMKLIEKRLAILLGAKFVDKSNLFKVIKNMERLRNRLTSKSKDFNGVKEIRNWRNSRCKF